MHPVDGEAEADYGQAGKYADKYAEDQEENFFVEDIFQAEE
jgi:hypothetical protein